jgi:hypothetical protein
MTKGNKPMLESKHIYKWCGTLLVALLTCASAHGQEAAAGQDQKATVEYALIFPDEKAPELVKPEDENPFVAVVLEDLKQDQTSSEENLVKERLLALSVVGASPRDGSFRVQLGDMILESGMVLPAFLPEQEVFLRVNTITDKEIEFVWLEKTKTGLPPRTLTMPIQIKPVVRYALPGQPAGKNGPERAYGRHDAHANALLAASRAEPPKRGEVLEDTPIEAEKVGAKEAKSASSARPKDSADAILDMFFNQGTGGVKGR